MTQPPIPEGNHELDEVLHALQSPATPAELSGMGDMVAAFQAAVLVAPFAPTPARNQIMIKKRLTGKALAAIGALTLISATAAAAASVVPSPFSTPRPTLTTPATSTLNAPVTSATATSETDNVDTESTDTEATDTAPTDTAPTDTAPTDTESTDTESTDAESTVTATTATATTATETTATATATATTETATTETPSTETATTDVEPAETADNPERGPDVNGPAKFGLCTAYFAHAKHHTGTTPTSGLAVPFQTLADAAAAAHKTAAEFCSNTTPGHSDKAPGHSDKAPGNSGTEPGNSGHGPSSTTPDQND